MPIPNEDELRLNAMAAYGCGLTKLRNVEKNNAITQDFCAALLFLAKIVFPEIPSYAKSLSRDEHFGKFRNTPVPQELSPTQLQALSEMLGEVGFSLENLNLLIGLAQVRESVISAPQFAYVGR